MSPTAVAESSLLLWLLGALVATLAAYVSLGWVRQGWHQPSLAAGWRGLLLAGAVYGTGLCAAMVLALASEALPFRVGFRWGAVPLIWLGAMLAGLPVLAWLARQQNWLSIVCGALWLAALAVVVQSAWIWAAGFRPGVTWRPEFQLAAALTAALGILAALYLSFLGGGKEGRRRQVWRVGAAAVMGLALMAAQEVLMAGAGLLAQVGTVFHREASASVLALVGGVIVPLLLAVMVMDLQLRRRQRKHDLRRRNDRSRRGARLTTPDRDSIIRDSVIGPETGPQAAPPAQPSRP